MNKPSEARASSQNGQFTLPFSDLKPVSKQVLSVLENSKNTRIKLEKIWFDIQEIGKIAEVLSTYEKNDISFIERFEDLLVSIDDMIHELNETRKIKEDIPFEKSVFSSILYLDSIGVSCYFENDDGNRPGCRERFQIKSYLKNRNPDSNKKQEILDSYQKNLEAHKYHNGIYKLIREMLGKMRSILSALTKEDVIREDFLK